MTSSLQVIGWALTVHIIFLTLNFTVTSLLKMPLPEKKAVVICASQKTLPIAITVLGFLPPAVGEEGVMAIACIIAQLTQILVDSMLIGMYPGWNDSAADDGADGGADGGAGDGTNPKASQEDGQYGDGGSRNIIVSSGRGSASASGSDSATERQR